MQSQLTSGIFKKCILIVCLFVCLKINWLDYLNAIYSSADIAIPKTERLVIVELDYLKQLVQLLNKTPPRVLGKLILIHPLAHCGCSGHVH